MLYLPGKSGDMYGKDIKYFYLSTNKNLITFNCGEITKTVNYSGTPLDYIGSPHYVEGNGVLIFKKPEPFYVPDWGFNELNGTDLVRNYVCQGEHKKFERCFGKSYYYSGTIEYATNAIEYWNTTNIKSTRLMAVICNYILKKEWHNIHLFINKKFHSMPMPKRTQQIVKLPRVKEEYWGGNGCKCEKSPKEVFGDYFPIFKKHIGKGLQIIKGSGTAGCGFTYQLRHQEDSNIIGEIKHIAACKWPLVINQGLLTLERPPLKNIPGIPWSFTNCDFKLNNFSCHFQVLLVRGGNYFKANEEILQQTETLDLDLDVQCFMSFVYGRKAVITQPKKELAVAAFFENDEFKDYIYNHMIVNDIYRYYKLK